MNISKLDKMKHKAHAFITGQQWPEARTQLEKVCKKFPKDFDGWHLLGAVCGQTNDIKNAVLACKKAVSIQPDNASALYNYGMALTKSGRAGEAVEAYKRSLAIEPDNPATLHNLGNTLKDIAQYDDAIIYLQKCIDLDPSKAEALFSLGSIYMELEKFTQAIEYLERSASLDLDVKIKADYFLSAINKNLNKNNIANKHVAKLHDEHAAIFDEHLTQGLGYTIPAVLFDRYKQVSPDISKQADILDLGCGTGLCGIEFKPIANKIIGVDLSPKMLAKARLTNTYNELIETDITEYLGNNKSRYDLIISADVFIYVGALDDILPACANALNNNGLMLFSVESIPGDSYKLRVSGRFAHSTQYIETLSKLAGLSLLQADDVVIRKELGKDIAGKIFVLKKTQ